MNSFAEADTPKEVLGLLAGAASVCWNKERVFESEKASKFVDDALERLIELRFV